MINDTIDKLFKVALREIPRLMRIKNVIGVGVGKKVRKGNDIGKMCIIIKVKEKLPLEKLEVHEVIRIDNEVTDVVEDHFVEMQTSKKQNNKATYLLKRLKPYFRKKYHKKLARVFFENNPEWVKNNVKTTPSFFNYSKSLYQNKDKPDFLYSGIPFDDLYERSTLGCIVYKKYKEGLIKDNILTTYHSSKNVGGSHNITGPFGTIKVANITPIRRQDYNNTDSYVSPVIGNTFNYDNTIYDTSKNKALPIGIADHAGHFSFNDFKILKRGARTGVTYADAKVMEVTLYEKKIQKKIDVSSSKKNKISKLLLMSYQAKFLHTRLKNIKSKITKSTGPVKLFGQDKNGKVITKVNLSIKMVRFSMGGDSGSVICVDNRTDSHNKMEISTKNKLGTDLKVLHQRGEGLAILGVHSGNTGFSNNFPVLPEKEDEMIRFSPIFEILCFEKSRLEKDPRTVHCWYDSTKNKNIFTSIPWGDNYNFHQNRRFSYKGPRFICVPLEMVDDRKDLKKLYRFDYLIKPDDYPFTEFTKEWGSGYRKESRWDTSERVFSSDPYSTQIIGYILSTTAYKKGNWKRQLQNLRKNRDDIQIRDMVGLYYVSKNGSKTLLLHEEVDYGDIVLEGPIGYVGRYTAENVF